MPGLRWDRLLFSAAESVYEAWFPLAHETVTDAAASAVRLVGQGGEEVVEVGDEGGGVFDAGPRPHPPSRVA